MCMQKYATAGERAVARKLLTEIKRRGFTFDVNDDSQGHGDTVILNGTNISKAMRNMATTGGDLITVGNAEGRACGWFSLVYGNADDGEELISDYCANELCESIYSAVEGL